MDAISIGQRLKEQRELQGYTRDQLAELLNITPRFCYDLEQGLKGMSLETLTRICQKLQVSADYILFGENPPSRNIRCSHIQALFNTCPEEQMPYLEEILTAFLKSTRKALQHNA